MSHPSGAHTQSSLIRPNHNAPLTRLVLFCAVLAFPGCAPLMSALASLSTGSQFAGSVVDAAEAGSRAYLQRHPNAEAEQKIDDAVRRARYALAALDGAVAAAGNVGADHALADPGVVSARAEALAAVLALRTLLADLGVLDARAPLGGAEGEGPPPKPVPLPAAAAIEAAL